VDGRWLLAVTCGTFIMLGSTPARAQSDGAWNVGVSTGGSATAGEVGGRLTGGWNIDLGAGFPVTRAVELAADFMYNGLGVSDQVLRTLQVPDGNARVLSLTAGPKVYIPIASHVRGYAVGAIGWYRRTLEFTQPTIGAVDIIDPWWGYVGTAIVPANQVIGSVSQNAFGGSIGGGALVALGTGPADLFVEVRYHRANTSPASTSLVPITFGIRFDGGRR
jgi:hypothetical protein